MNTTYTQLEFPFMAEFPPPTPTILDYTPAERSRMMKNEPKAAAQLVFDHFRAALEKELEK
jgi:hypothetical protein